MVVMSPRPVLACGVLLGTLVSFADLTGTLDASLNAPALVFVVWVTLAGALWSFPASVLRKTFGSCLGREPLPEAQALQGHAVFDRLSKLAMSAGLIGTLIELMNMLAMMEDPGKVGLFMAAALLNALYGILLGPMGCAAMGHNFLARGGLTTKGSLAPHRPEPFSKMLAGLFIVLFSFSLLHLSFQSLPEDPSDTHRQEFLQAPAPEVQETK
jgi:hypothetical protein